MSSASRVASRFLTKPNLSLWGWREAREFSNKDELAQYLKDHPKANKDLHWVKDQKREPKSETDFVQGWSGSRTEAVSKYRTGDYKHTPLKGKMKKAAVEDIKKNARGVLRTYAHHLPGDDVDNLHELISTQSSLLTEALKAGDLTGADAETVNLMIMDSVHNLVYQTHESYHRQLGDHGVRHIKGNIDTQNDVFDALAKSGKKVSSLQRLQAMMVQINHDMGYTAAPSKADIKYTGKHKEFSSDIFQSEYEDGYREVFGDDTDKMVEWIKTHDSDQINWDDDPVGSAIRVADNLSLFAKEKLPGLFRFVPGAIEDLEELGAASKAKDEAKGEEIKVRLKKKVEDSELSAPIKKALLNAAEEVSLITAKFTLGMLGGKLGVISFKDGHLNVEVDQDPYDTKLQQLFDMGQRQFGKLAEAYGYKDFTGDSFDFQKDGKTVLGITYKKVKGSK